MPDTFTVTFSREDLTSVCDAIEHVLEHDALAEQADRLTRLYDSLNDAFTSHHPDAPEPG